MAAEIFLTINSDWRNTAQRTLKSVIENAKLKVIGILSSERYFDSRDVCERQYGININIPEVTFVEQNVAPNGSCFYL